MKGLVATIAALMLVISCGGEETPDVGTIPVEGYVHAGPVCPVVQDPPDPNCADFSVEGAELQIRNAADNLIRTVATDADGTFSILLSPGAFTIVPQPVEGLLGTAEAQSIEVTSGPVALDFAYDTGIR